MTSLLVAAAPNNAGCTPTGRAVEKLRRFQKQPRAIFEAYRMTPLQYASKTVGTAESNISKWAKDEDKIVENAANKITGNLMKNNRSKALFPRAEQELHKLFRAKRKRWPQGVYPLALCHHERPHQAALPRGSPGRNVHPFLALYGKVGEELESHHKAEEATRKIRASRSASPRSSASTSRCSHSCRTRHQSLVGRPGQVRGGTVELHR